ncbi:type VI secretion system baseplate subunit TssF, partial [candidate division KSB1 bacterium]|nr:type VI secretion system baseplate subunit TssF [candidate division KSB1 bacterium]
MSIEKYFEREYNFLQVAGEEFAEKNQAIAGKLRLSQRQRKDPFVERLFEGFAFLSGRIHERLDDELPEITGGLLEQLFPHFLRPFPSCAILEAKPKIGALTQPVTIERGSEVQTPTGRYKVKYKVGAGAEDQARIIEHTEPAEFIFRTTQKTTVRPIRLREVRVEEAHGSMSALVLQIQPDRNVAYETLDLKRLTIFLHGSLKLKYTLLLYLTKHVASLSVSEIVGGKKDFQEIKPFRIGIPELTHDFDVPSEDRSVIPYAQQTFTGYRLLHEYFSFPDRFFFVDIEGLHQFKASQEGLPFEIKITFNRKLSAEYKPKIKDILLHCTPIVNLFERSTEEVPVNQRMPEYYVIPDMDRRKSKEIYSVNKVTGVSENKLQQYLYMPITSYDVLDTADPEYEYKRFYSTTTRPHPADMSA